METCCVCGLPVEGPNPMLLLTKTGEFKPVHVDCAQKRA